MARRVTKRKQNKRTKKRTTKSANRKTRSVNKRSKYSGGMSFFGTQKPTIPGLQGPIQINTRNLGRKIADCYVFPLYGCVCVLFQLNHSVGRGLTNAISSATKGIVNAPLGYVHGFASVLGAHGVADAYAHNSAAYALAKNLTEELKGFTGGLINNSTLTGVGETTSYQAQTIFFCFPIDAPYPDIYQPNGYKTKTIPFNSNWLNAIDKSNFKDVVDEEIKLKIRRQKAGDKWDPYDDKNNLPKLRLESNEIDQDNAFTYTLNSNTEYDKKIQTAFSNTKKFIEQARAQQQMEQPAPAQQEIGQPAQAQ
jgi:hypothetical protein